jgi:hypothetical protein
MDTITNEQREFEALFPMPKQCERCGDGYVATGYSAWDAHNYVHMWNGWKARAKTKRLAEAPITNPNDVTDEFEAELRQLKDDAKALVARAERAGLNIEIVRVASWPWEVGSHKPEITFWPLRKFTRPQ